jgi:hypothetical protein
MHSLRKKKAGKHFGSDGASSPNRRDGETYSKGLQKNFGKSAKTQKQDERTRAT